MQLLHTERFSGCIHQGQWWICSAWIVTVNGAPTLNLANANKHVPKIKRKIWVIKEQVRAGIYSIPFNSLPDWMLIQAVSFMVKQLNLFLVKGGLSSKLSPKQIMLNYVRWVSAIYILCYGLWTVLSNPWRGLPITIWQQEGKVQFCLDLVGTPKGEISCILWLLEK